MRLRRARAGVTMTTLLLLAITAAGYTLSLPIIRTLRSMENTARKYSVGSPMQWSRAERRANGMPV